MSRSPRSCSRGASGGWTISRRRSGGRPSRSGGSTRRTTTCSCRSTGSTRRTALRPRSSRSKPCWSAPWTPTPSGSRSVPRPPRTAGGRGPPAARHLGRRPQPRRGPCARRGVARHLHVGSAAPRTWRLRRQGSRGHRGSARPARRRRIRDGGRQRSGALAAGGGGRDGRPGIATEPFPSVPDALDAAARGSLRGRPHPGDGLSVHCRGRPPGARGGPLR